MIHVVYCPKSPVAPKSGCVKNAKRRVRILEAAGFEVCLRPLSVEDIQEFKKRSISPYSEEDKTSLCWLIIYDDTRQGKYMTNETELSSLEEVSGFFRTREERTILRNYYLSRAYALGL